ncbi:MAG: tetratricopeptide repeat protein [Bryobacterales bacterium]|nr:tetratricopeptide repeat protein [Bryobacterales bacterium]
MKAGKDAEAVIEYRKAIQKAPEMGEAYHQLGLIDLKSNRLLPAYQNLVRAAQLMPGNEAAVAAAGKLALSLYNADPGRPRQLYDQAARAADLLLGKDGGSFDGNVLKGALVLADFKPGEAVVFLRKAVGRKPEDVESQLLLARALAENKEVAESTSIAEELIRRDKNFARAYDALFQNYEATGRTKEAEEILKLKAANNPKNGEYLFDLAAYYASRKRMEDADTAIARLTANPKEYPNGRLLAGDFYFSVGRPDEALAHLNAGVGGATADAPAYRKRLARILAFQRKWKEALDQLELALRAQPADGEAKQMRAVAWLDEGDPQKVDGAIEELRAQLTSRPEDAPLRFQIGKGLVRKGDIDGGAREWRVAMRSNRNYLPPRFALAQLLMARGKAEEALTISKEVVALKPAELEANLLHVACLTAAGQFQPARSELGRLNVRFPKSPFVQLRFGVLAIAEGKHKEAERIFRQMEGDLGKNSTIAAGLAEALYGSDRAGEAIGVLENYLQHNPSSPRLRKVLARIAQTAGRYDVAVDQYKALSAAEPKSSEYQLALAEAYSAKGENGLAKDVLDKVIAVNPKSAPASLLLAKVLLAAGQVSEAMGRYRRTIEIEPTNVYALNDLAFLMAESGQNLDEALKYARRGLEAAVEPAIRAELSDTLGWIYVKMKKNDNALGILTPLVNGNQMNATFRYHLGVALQQNGESEKARIALRAALAARPNSADEKRIRELLAIMR